MPFTILIVDDDFMNREILQTHLESAGYHVLTANNGTKGVEITVQQHPDLVLTDVRMPDMSGFDVCIELKSRPAVQHIPILLLTAYEDEATKTRGLQSGASGFVTKPFEIKTILSQIHALIGET
jgi:CheY-like chemotaxis protein